jgi:hypothetical protein
MRALILFLVLACSVQAGTVKLAWNANSPGQYQVGYYVWEGFFVPFHGSYFVKFPTLYTTTSATLTNVSSGQFHFYYVTAYVKVLDVPVQNSSGMSPRSRGWAHFQP